MTIGMIRFRDDAVMKGGNIAARKYVCGGKRRRGLDSLQQQDVVEGRYEEDTTGTDLGMQFLFGGRRSHGYEEVRVP